MGNMVQDPWGSRYQLCNRLNEKLKQLVIMIILIFIAII